MVLLQTVYSADNVNLSYPNNMFLFVGIYLFAPNVGFIISRAMELGRECLKLWGYERVDEIIWVKTNQLQRIIRTGRTGHWLNHGKEHCLVCISLVTIDLP